MIEIYVVAVLIIAAALIWWLAKQRSVLREQVEHYVTEIATLKRTHYLAMEIRDNENALLRLQGSYERRAETLKAYQDNIRDLTDQHHAKETVWNSNYQLFSEALADVRRRLRILNRSIKKANMLKNSLPPVWAVWYDGQAELTHVLQTLLTAAGAKFAQKKGWYICDAGRMYFNADTLIPGNYRPFTLTTAGFLDHITPMPYEPATGQLVDVKQHENSDWLLRVFTQKNNRANGMNFECHDGHSYRFCRENPHCGRAKVTRPYDLSGTSMPSKKVKFRVVQMPPGKRLFVEQPETLTPWICQLFGHIPADLLVVQADYAKIKAFGHGEVILEQRMAHIIELAKAAGVGTGISDDGKSCSIHGLTEKEITIALKTVTSMRQRPTMMTMVVTTYPHLSGEIGHYLDFLNNTVTKQP